MGTQRTLDMTNLMADLSVLSKVGDIKLTRKFNTYTVEKSFSNDKFTFIIGNEKENIAFDFTANGKKVFPPTVNEFIRMIEDSSNNITPDTPVVDKRQQRMLDEEAAAARRNALSGNNLAEPIIDEGFLDEGNDETVNYATQAEKRKVLKGVKARPKPIEQNNFDESDLELAASQFAQAIAQRQNSDKNIHAKIAELEEMIKNAGVAKPKQIIINDLPKIDLDENACAILEDLIRAAYTRQNAYIFGPAGCGKTTAAKQVAKAMSLPFGYICLTAGASETWLFGRNTPNGFIEGQFSLLYKNGGVFLADEMDAADSNLLIALNTAIDSDVLLNPMSGEVIKKHKDFIFIGAGNTNGLGATGQYNGRNKLDASTLSRFVFFEMDYDEELEKNLCLDANVYDGLIAARRYLVNRKSENFVTTRDFIKLSKMLHAGCTYEFIANSLTANFSEVERKEVKAFFKFKTPAKKKVEATQDEIPF